METIVIVTGGFDPVHSGHVEYINNAAEYGNVIIGLNSDKWLERKKGKYFLPFRERKHILSAFKNVLTVIGFDDSDGSARDAIATAKKMFPRSKIIFANGGDRTKTNIPELERYKDDPSIEFMFGVGGENKMNSSSWILDNWKNEKTERPWGHYKVLHQIDRQVKVKELVVEPGMCLSMQKHAHRAEHWFVADGTASVYTINQKQEVVLLGKYKKFDPLHIEKEQWHKLCNESSNILKIVEIQYGDNCAEEDIVRKV